MTAAFVAYFRERLRLRLFGPVVLLLAVAACWVSSARAPWACVGAAGLMTLLVVQFRLWDDLADRARDRVTHPDRVLVRADARPFTRFAIALAIVGGVTAGWMGGLTSFLAVVSLNATFGLLYARLRPRLSAATWQYPVLLAKYPAFVAIVAVSIGAPSGGRMIVAALLTYGAAIAYEAVHSGRTNATRLAPHGCESSGRSK